jgi:putative ABC transport system ATP-binding protein
VIEVTGLTKRYVIKGESVFALQDVTLSFPDGTYAGISGPSGSGKSTLLFTIAGLIRPTAGQVQVEHQPLYALSGADRARLRAETMGFVFQMFYLVPYLTVRENVAVALGARGRGSDDGRVREVLDRVGLGHRVNHKPAQLSTGEQQRVALARAVVNRPRILLADEPTGNLDPALAGQLLDFLDEFHKDGMTVLLATHDPNAAARAKVAVRLLDGRVVAS